MQKLIYLASPYTHKNKLIEKHRYDVITEIAARLTKEHGYAMFLPITQSYAMCKYEPSLGGKFEAWKDIDLFMVREKADELWVVMLDGWKDSIGVAAEIEEAKKRGIPIKYIENTYRRLLRSDYE